MEISCAFATSPSTPQHIVEAEKLGYRRAWCYDSPALYPDVWMILALAAERTTRIGIGPAVLVPSLRHPMVNATAIATLAGLAPGRVAVAVGSGFTGRHALGLKPMRWSDVGEYIRVVRALLRGDEARWDGRVIKMIHPEGFIPDAPVRDVPLLVGAAGPRGLEVAGELGDGVFSVGGPPRGEGLPQWRAVIQFGTVLDDDEPVTNERVLDAAGHSVAVGFHAAYERGGAWVVDRLPGGQIWRRGVEQVDSDRRHLVVHEGHLVKVSERDRPAVVEALSVNAVAGITGTAAEVRQRVAELADRGATEVAFQPAGSDIPAELRRFIDAVTSL